MNRGYRNINRRTPVIPIVMIVLFVLILAVAAFRYRYSFDNVIGKWYTVWVVNEYGVMSCRTIAEGEGQPLENYVSTLEFRGDGTVKSEDSTGEGKYNWRRYADTYTLYWQGSGETQEISSYTYSGERGGLLIYTDPANGHKIVFSQDPDIYVEETYMENLSRANPDPTAVPTPTPAVMPGYNAGDSTYDPGTAYSGDGASYGEDSSYDVETDDGGSADEDYIFPYSDSQYLTKEDLKGMSYQEVWLAKNELYARHGRMFNNEELQEYFDSCSWYIREYTPEEWDELGDRYFFNDYEIENRNLLKKREDKLK